MWKSAGLQLRWRQLRFACQKAEVAEVKKFAMPEKVRPIEQMLELNEEEPLSPELLDSQVQKAQEQLLQLKRQQEQIEKQKRELEELSRRQEELERGRTEMADKLTRSLVVLEREAHDAQTRLEQLRAMRESFMEHLGLIEAIDPKSWNPADLHKELSRALSTVEGARAEYSQQRSRLQATGNGGDNDTLPEVAPDILELNGHRSFGKWMQIGFAFSLPLIIFGLIALFVLLWMGSSTR
jgi:chromosome segregation ATPase